MHPVFNPVAPYRYLLSTVYLFMADIANPDLFVYSCHTWISIDIIRFYEEQHQPSSGFACPACFKSSKSGPHCWGRDTICTAVCNRRDSSTACRMCRFQPCHMEIILKHNYVDNIWPQHKLLYCHLIINSAFGAAIHNCINKIFTVILQKEHAHICDTMKCVTVI